VSDSRSELQTETRATYDQIAPEYLRLNLEMSAERRADMNGFASVLPPSAVVADIGCGPGIEVALLRQLGLRVIGLDLSMGQLRAAASTGLAQADMRRLPLRAESLDGLWCHAALLHIPREMTPQVLAEFARVTRVGGALSLFVAEGDGEAWENADHYGSDRRRWFTFHRLPDLAALLAAAGFAIRRTRATSARRDWLSVSARRVPSQE
jgi:ubiquinone/menaquinone biosynthesis C-methylase UbiE